MFTNGPSRSIGGGGYGQNLAMWGSSGDPESFGASGSVARAASNGWYNNELGLFPSSDYGKASPDMSNFEKWGHYSQLVWKGTQKVGCATKFCAPGTMSSFGSWYTVCNYYPAGMFLWRACFVCASADSYTLPRQHGRSLRRQCPASPGPGHRQGGRAQALNKPSARA